MNQPLSEAAFQLCCLLTLLIPLALAGLALLNVGLGRSHSAAHAMLASLCAVAVAAIAFLFAGIHLQTHPLQPNPRYTPHLSSKPQPVATQVPTVHPSAEPAPQPTTQPPAKLDLADPHTALTALFGTFAVALAALIPISAGADRWRLAAICLSTAILAAVLYPLFAGWAGPAGWLGQLGTDYGLGRGFLDTGGAGSVHTLAGLSALTVTWLLGPRRNKYPGRGTPDRTTPAAIPGHNIVLVLSGCLVLLPGWIALNAAGALLSGTLAPAGLPALALATLLSAAGGALAALALTRLRFGKPDASLTANGWVAGLVAGSAAPASFSPLAALATGLIAGILVIYTIELLELRLFLDDPAGAISVHAVAGIWGLLAAGLFAHTTPSTPTLPGQLLAQTVGIATLLGLILPATYLLNWCADRLLPFRVDDDGERQGMDLRELGAGAYPEFVVHRDEFSQR